MKFYVIFFAVVAIVISCRKEQPDMAQLLEKCSCAHEVSADFYMEEVFGYNIPSIEKFTNTDSIFGGKIIRFRALEENAEYTWYLGQETESGTSEVLRTFPESYIGQSLPITLVVKKKPNHICFPNDDGYDSITKYLTVAMTKDDYYDRTDVPLSGIFRVKSSSMTDSVDIVSKFKTTFGGNQYFTIHNIPNYNGSDSLYSYDLISNYRQHWSHMSQYMIDFHHRIDGKVIIDMKNLNPGQPSQYFEGRKL